MKIIVDKMPENARECLFSWKHIEYHKRKCRFSGVCKIENSENCKFLREYQRDEVNAYKRGYEKGKADIEAEGREE